jgi:tetratricopeptide (TPR) repeat protein
MGGGGMAQAMINSLRQNKNLLGKRKTIYTRKKDKIKPRSKKINIPELNLIQKRAIQAAQKKEQLFAKKKALKTLTLVIGLIIILFVVIANIPFQSKILPESKPIKTEINTVYDFNKNMNMGLAHMQIKQWFFAIGYFEKAITINPNNKELQYQLALAYCSLCFYENKACKAAHLVLNSNTNGDINRSDYEMLQLNCLK